MKQVVKRDGRHVDFDGSKIEEAVLKCFKAVDGEISDFARQKAKNITEHIEGLDTNILGVEEIQDLVERGLMSSKRKDVARAYITYRDERTRARNRNAQIMRTVKEKLDASNVVNQNANIDEKSFGGRRGEASNEIMKQYALDNILSDMARENHLNNRIYIHDLDSYAVGMHNCLTIPFDDLLAKGFNTRQTDVRPANSANTAFQLVAVLFQLQSLQQFGGVSASHLDWTMVPYVRKSFAKHYKDGWVWINDYDWKDVDYEIENMVNDPTAYSIEDPEWEAYDYKAYNYAKEMTEREVYQAVEGMYHNLKY